MDKIKTLKDLFTGRLTTESTADQIEQCNKDIAALDEINTEYESLQTENAKLKNTIINMVQNQGDGKTPPPLVPEQQPKTMDEILADLAK